MKCNNCGADLADNAKFCTSCGANVEAQGPQDGQGAQSYKYFRPRKNQADIRKLGMVIGGAVLALLLVIFVVFPLFNKGLSEKKAVKIVENTTQNLMDFKFDKASKNFANVTGDEYKDFVDEYLSMQSELSTELVNNSLGDFIDVKVKPVTFTCNKDVGIAKGTFNLVFSLNKKGMQNPTVIELFSTDLENDELNMIEIEFVKVGRKWKINPTSELLFNTNLSERQFTKIVQNTMHSIMDFDFDKASKYFADVNNDGYMEMVDGVKSLQSVLGPFPENKTLADFMDIEVTAVTFECNEEVGTAQGTYNVSFSLNKKGLENSTLNELLNMALASGGPQTLEVEFVKVGRKWKISEIDD